MLKFTAFFNIIVFDDYHKFPKLRLGVLVLTILHNLFISELLDDFYNFPKSELGVSVFNHPYNLFISELFKRNAKTQFFFEKSDFFEFEVNKCYFKQISPLSLLINVKLILFIQEIFCRFGIYSYLCSKI